MPLFNITSDGNGGSHLPKTKPNELKAWLVGGGLFTIIVTFSSILYAAGAKSSDIKTNTQDIVVLKKDVVELKACQARDLLETAKNLGELKTSIGSIETNINWLVSQEKSRR